MILDSLSVFVLYGNFIVHEHMDMNISLGY